MAEYSRFWDAVAPVAEPYIYDDDEISEAMGRSRWQNGVLLGLDNECIVTPQGGSKNVLVDTGQANIRGYWYQNDASIIIAIPDHAGVSRTDRIILRWTAATKTIAAARLAGAEGSTAPAALTQTAAVYEIPLAIVYVTNANLLVSDIAEDRQFAQPYSRTIQRNFNLIENGHCSGLSTTEPWDVNNLTVASSTTQHYFGTRSFFCTSTLANGYLRQTIASEYLFARPYYVRAWVYVTAGTIRMDVNGAGLTKDFPREIQTTGTGAWELLEGTFMADGVNDVNIDFIATTHTPDTFYVDAVMVLEGGSYDLYVPNQIQMYQQKNIFVPCVAARNTTGGADIERDTAEGWEFADAVDTEGYGNWNLPYDYVDGTDIILDPVWSEESAGHGVEVIVLRDLIYHAYFLECWNTVNPALDSAWQNQIVKNACAVTFGTNLRITSTVIDQNDTLFFTFYRDGNAAGDTFTGSIYFLGWMVYYYARENIS